MILDLKKKVFRLRILQRFEKHLLSLGFEKDTRNEDNTTYRGVLHSSSECKYLIRIVFTSEFPYKQPSVYIDEPKIINCRHQEPTEDSSSSGALCVYNERKTGEWHRFVTCEEFMAKVQIWINKHATNGLESEKSPPELSRYYPSTYKDSKIPLFIVQELLMPIENGQEGLIETLKYGNSIFINHLDSAKIEKYNELIYERTDINARSTLPVPVFYTDAEPFPICYNIKELFDYIYKHQKAPKLSKTNLLRKIISSPIIALSYDIDDGNQWIHFSHSVPNMPKVKNGKICGYRSLESWFSIAQGVKTGKICLMTQTTIISYEAIYKRNKNQFPKLEHSKILLIGAGTIGSKIADLLVKSGLSNLTIIDKDVLAVGNICRHILGVDSINKNKSDELCKRLLKTNPFADLTPIVGDVLNNNYFNTSFLSEFDLVISCVGNNDTEAIICDACTIAKKPVFFIRTYRMSLLGEVVFYNEGLPCIECINDLKQREDCIFPKITPGDFSDIYMFDTDCGSPFIPAAAIDIEFISVISTQLILQYIENLHLAENYYLIRGRDVPKHLTSNFPMELLNSYQIHKYNISKEQIPVPCNICD
ncbi:MAG TPA: ThiF family adenylyltransferase [Candidatus Cloacimonadota bacterium]|nr:ThiF family adenylyltransferase [Candidatus Cloacimonadota bacterium]